jgi:hypothetical protein
MGEFLKCECPHCGQSIEYPSEGTGETVPCPTCEKPVILTPVNSSPEFVAEESEKPKRGRTNLSKLTEETIRAKTSAGNTPVHLAAKNGKIDLIPSHLLSAELFMDRNNDGNTPLHIAAMKGTLNQVPHQFLTEETLTIPQAPYYAPDGFHITGSGYKAQSPTVLHVAAYNGYLDQIPKEFFTPDFLLIEATGYRQTVLEYIVKNKRLDLLPENYAESQLWNIKASNGQTPREILEILIEREAQLEVVRAERQTYIASVRSEPATEKQKEKLRYFGYAFDENISKGQASDALDKCVRDFPEVNQAYYNRPATEAQLVKLPSRFKTERAQPLSYGRAKDLILERELEKQNKNDEKLDRELLIAYINDDLSYPSLTQTRIKKAAKALDESAPGWHEKQGCEKVLLEKVAELNPELAVKEDWLDRLPYL